MSEIRRGFEYKRIDYFVSEEAVFFAVLEAVFFVVVAFFVVDAALRVVEGFAAGASEVASVSAVFAFFNAITPNVG